MCSDVAISVKNLTKTYRLFGHPGDRIKQFFSLGIKQYHKEFTALKDVSFEIKRGETVGIIGRNGSGKSTLLQLICGILKPTSGSVQVNGRISALLELGAGFNQEFTGRENVYFQGTLMGFTKVQMDERFDEIAAFADIGEFIEQPVRTYSSGMFVRLAFAVAIHADPDILVIDEALAVGDAQFQAKCFERMHMIREAGGCILLVSHSAEQVAHFCERAVLLDKGIPLAVGNTVETLERYLDLLHNSDQSVDSASLHEEFISGSEPFCMHPAYSPNEKRWGDRAATLHAVSLHQAGRQDSLTFFSGAQVDLRMHVRFHAEVSRPIYGIVLKTKTGAQVFGTNSINLGVAVPSQKAGDEVEISYTFHPHLDTGDYFISLGVVGDSPQGIVVHDRRYDALHFNISHQLTAEGEIAMKPEFSLHILR